MENIKDSIDLKSLVGEHVLSGCDCTTEQVKDWGETHVSAGVMRFVMDGKTYEAIEDPDDGYRSSLEGLHIAPDGTVVQNTFESLSVVATHRVRGDDKYGGEDDVLEIRVAKTGHLIIAIGTEDIDDYYPGCVMSFTPIQ